MERKLKIGFGLLVVGALLLGATTTVSADRALVHDSTANSAQDVEPGECDPPCRADYRTVDYERLDEDERSIYLEALRKDGPVRTASGGGFDRVSYGDDPTVLIVEFPENGSQPEAFDGDPDDQYDAMLLTTEPGRLPTGVFVLKSLAVVLGVLSLLGGVGSLFFSE